MSKKVEITWEEFTKFLKNAEHKDIKMHDTGHGSATQIYSGEFLVAEGIYTKSWHHSPVNRQFFKYL